MNRKKWFIGIISSISVILLIGLLTWSSLGENDTNTASKTANKTVTKETSKNEDSEKEKLDGKDKDVENTKEEEESKTEESSSRTDKKEEETKKTVTEIEDGTKTTATKSTGNNPKGIVKVEKNTKTEIKQETKTGSNTSSNSGSNNNSTKDSITTKTTTTTESIAFKTIRQNDSSLEKRKEVVAQNGQDGVRTITYKETYTNGKLTSKEQVSSKVTKNPVDKIIKVGTKEPQPTKLSVSEAHSILGGSGMTKSGDTYTLRLSDVTDVMVKVGSNGVSSITFNGASYIPWKGVSKEEMIEIFGKEEGTKEYEWMKGQAAKIEKAVRAAANVVYSSGTSQANSLYNQIINSNSYSKSF